MYGILVYDGVEPVDIGATVGVLSMARRIAPDLHYVTIAKSAGEIVCANGLRCIAEYGVNDAPQLTDLIVTGGPGWVDVAADREILDFIGRSKARLASICTGAMILSAAGRLARKKATTKHQVFAGETPPSRILNETVSVEHSVLVDDTDTVTGGGVTLGFDTMFYCLARSHGTEVARQTARVMEYSRALTANRSALGYSLYPPTGGEGAGEREMRSMT